MIGLEIGTYLPVECAYAPDKPYREHPIGYTSRIHQTKEEVMDPQRVIGELETLGRLLPADGWGDHYVEAVNEAARLLRDHVESEAEAHAV
jgi:hypothetical protein